LYLSIQAWQALAIKLGVQHGEKGRVAIGFLRTA
jgi:hypothetical protein